MKLEASELTAALVLVVGGWWASLSTGMKGVIIAITLLGAGATAGVTVYQQLALPDRVSSLEARYTRLESRVSDTEDMGRTQTLLLQRVICRLDGNTANSCDLRYGGDMRIPD